MQNPINFKLWNNLTAWLVFAVSLFVYFKTLEPTVSFWDCGEFISCAYNLEVSHPPGAPFFMLLGRIAALLNPSNPTLMINGLSAVASAFTILFLFWTITWFGRKLYDANWDESNISKISILVAGVVGSLSYAFTDSFWFSAVEAEVYGLSSMLTALVFWCILKWEESMDVSPNHERWLILIAYLFGLSVGVHLLNLLVIPAIVMVFYFKKYPLTKITLLKALGASVLILFTFLVIILKGIPHLLSLTELLAVNTFNLPYNTGFLTALMAVCALPVIFYYVSIKKNKHTQALWLICLAFVLAGLSSYGVIVIRSYDNPSIDMTNPEDPFSLENYLNREQYGARPLLYGQAFNSPAIETKERTSYQRNNNAYVKYPLNPKIIYDPQSLTLFPRMSSDQDGHPEAYKSWTGEFHGKTIQNHEGATRLPSLGDNLRFFFAYQLGYMYIRYFMWNFAGKQNDIQGRGTAVYGNWKSGIQMVDNLRLGNQNKQPGWLKNNKGNNSYYFIPLILGLIGFFYQARKDKNNFLVTLSFFVLTGIALVVYLNEVPVTPRERDYVYVGSFYIFSLWIGLGVISLFKYFSAKSSPGVAIVIASSLAIISPCILLQQNYDDHNRAQRYSVLEYARNYLESCEPNAILFTNADNDTYPLWYAQEVEGIRRDIRLILTPYLSAEWYVDQMRRPVFGQEGLQMKLTREKYLGGKRAYLPVIEKIDSAVELSAVIDFVGSDDERALVGLQNGESVNFIPARKILLPGINTISKDSLNSNVVFALKNNMLRMDELVLLDIISTNNWKRPVYFASEQVPVSLGIEKHLRLDGFAYKLTPDSQKTTSHDEIGYIDTELLYKKLMVDFSFASIANNNVYLDNSQVYTINVINLRNKFARLAEKLYQEGDTTKAEAVLDKIVTMLHANRVPFDYSMGKITALYFMLHKPEKGKEVYLKVKSYCTENLEYFAQLKKDGKALNTYDVNINMYLLQILAEIAQKNNMPEYVKEIQEFWNRTAGGLG